MSVKPTRRPCVCVCVWERESRLLRERLEVGVLPPPKDSTSRRTYKILCACVQSWWKLKSCKEYTWVLGYILHVRVILLRRLVSVQSRPLGNYHFFTCFMSCVLFDELIIRAAIRSVIIYVVCRRFGDKCSFEAVLRGQVLRAKLGPLGETATTLEVENLECYDKGAYG